MSLVLLSDIFLSITMFSVGIYFAYHGWMGVTKRTVTFQPDDIGEPLLSGEYERIRDNTTDARYWGATLFITGIVVIVFAFVFSLVISSG